MRSMTGGGLLNMSWQTLSGIPVPGIREWVRERASEGQEVYVGTDSLQRGLKTQFVTVVAILTPMKGGRVAYVRETVPRIQSLRERLLKEVQRSVDLALELAEVVPGVLT